MNPLIAAAGVLLVAAITPGPNNLVVLTAGARAGFLGALPAMAGVVTGTLALVTVAVFGAGAAFAAEPRLRIVIAAAGCAYLVWLGLQLMMKRGGVGSSAAHASNLPSGAASLFVFQFLNPKSWVTVLAVTATAPGEASVVGYWPLLALFVLIPAACLMVWALFGSVLAGHLAAPGRAMVFHRAMGALLLASAVLMWLAP